MSNEQAMRALQQFAERCWKADVLLGQIEHDALSESENQELAEYVDNALRWSAFLRAKIEKGADVQLITIALKLGATAEMLGTVELVAQKDADAERGRAKLRRSNPELTARMRELKIEQGLSYGQIAIRLNDDGTERPRGGKWKYNDVKTYCNRNLKGNGNT